MTKDEKKKLVEEISSSFYNSIRGNSKIQRIITDGAASSEEVAKLAKQLGAYLRSAVVHGFTDIELLEGEEMSELAKEILEPLMKYSHELVGKAAKDVYTAFNEENNIDINPKLPDFPKARFDQIISAAGEEDKPRETILRRISVVPETVITSMSDNNTRACARAYSSAGFEAYITRSAAKGCCEWCSKMFGKFEYPKNTPKDIFRRHDNCECIVTYSCGSMRQNVHSRETWEQPEVKVPELTKNPDVNVPELTSGLLTEEKNNDIIKLGINLFDKTDSIFLDAFSIEEEYGFKDIFIHGSPSSVQMKINGKLTNLSPTDFVKILKQNGYSGGDIRLASCSTGKGDNSFAQQLSELLGVKVKAPDDDVYFIPNEGIMFVGSEYMNTGKWRLFDKGVEIID